jgi:hypothetical protein
MNCYSVDEQRLLIAKGMEQLQACGVGTVTSYRAGGFGANFDTLAALSQNGIRYDSSYNACWLDVTCKLHTPTLLMHPERFSDVHEFPVAIFQDWPGHYRPAQLRAASSAEIETALLEAWKSNWHSFVIVSHSFELVKRWDWRGRLTCIPDTIVIRRFNRLCNFLAVHREKFRTALFTEMDPTTIPSLAQTKPFATGLHHTAWRLAEQAYKRIF